MHTVRLILFRLMSLVLAGLVLVWAGAASADDAFDSASELVQQISEQDQPTFSADNVGEDPLDCPAFVSDFPLFMPALCESRPAITLPPFRSVLPRPTSPPPRRA